MYRGTTPTHIFNLPIDIDILSKLRITYAQDDKIIFCKTESDCVLEGRKVSVKLSQEETLKFDCKKMVQIQLKMLTKGNDSLLSPIYARSVNKCLDNEVL